ncbi:hypothetical protein GCM10008992_10060 [Halorubrum aquaticum]
MVTPLVVYSIVSKNNTEFYDLINMVMLLYIFFVIYHNESRAAVVSYLLSILIIFIMYYGENYVKILWMRFGLLIYLISTITYILLPLVIENPFDQDINNSLHVRWELMYRGAEYIYGNPLIGSGLGEFDRATSTATIGYLPTTPHNWIIQLGVETGILGLILFVLLVGTLIDQLVILYQEDKADWALPISVSLLLFPISGLGPSDVLVNTQIFWIILNLAIIITIVSKNPRWE